MAVVVVGSGSTELRSAPSRSTSSHGPRAGTLFLTPSWGTVVSTHPIAVS